MNAHRVICTLIAAYAIAGSGVAFADWCPEKNLYYYQAFPTEVAKRMGLVK